MISLKKIVTSALAFALAVSPSSYVAADLVQNGSFATNSNSAGGEIDYNTTLSNWSTTRGGTGGLGLVGTVAQYHSGITDQYGTNNFQLPASVTASPFGGNFVALDGGGVSQGIQQTITGLTSGKSYVLTFDWATSQQSGSTPGVTEQFQVGFGSSTQSTSVTTLAAPSQFSGWSAVTMTFVADSTSDVLSFFSVGTPSGQPPMALLDGVSLSAAVPEPGSLILVGLGMAALGIHRLSRRKRLALA